MSSAPALKPQNLVVPGYDPRPAARRRETEDASGSADLPVEQRSLVMRLSEEVAALRRALDASQHRIAALEVEAAEEPISGLLNRRAFIREIERAIAFQTRYPMTCGIGLIDVDGMDAIRDAQGQSGLNRALRLIGETLRAGIRSCDVTARTGNEQFAVVLWNSTTADCGHRVLGLQRAIAGLADVLDGQASLATRSAVVMIEPGATADQVIATADRLLLEAMACDQAMMSGKS
ncbi:GGDEF domain-containing protein [Kaistia defluvii]|uniref:GGDEF domain-containing protein n=1 Tax=Kaistia defluvii TaxID=410841 RepID=UPI002259D44D|nr:GGDEF domain-containing protein [Kaistia defluvii]MCX5517665.1 GGDEF domain-containing protein [Kaistia defluvii]